MDDGLRGLRLANISAFLGGILTAMAAFLFLARYYGIDPFQVTGPEVVNRLSTGSAFLLFGGTVGAGIFGSFLGPALFGYGRWDRIDELSNADLQRIAREGLTVKCPACQTPNLLVIAPASTPSPPVHTSVVCRSCHSTIRARVSGTMLAVGNIASKAAVRRVRK